MDDSLKRATSNDAGRFAAATWLSALGDAGTNREVLALVDEFVTQLDANELGKLPEVDSPQLRLMFTFLQAASVRLNELSDG
ncbi:MAG TPA: hypothetical protein VN598_04295 [Usitatibacter sp.]|nr:hypothetical protein [Usitatibacter sp.]HXS51455.1 hypothetical protein [Usitatibacter sp.]